MANDTRVGRQARQAVSLSVRAFSLVGTACDCDSALRPGRRPAFRGENSGLPRTRRGVLHPRLITVTHATLKPNDTRSLDALTGGAFSAPTSGERAARVREWLAASPSQEQMQEVFRELSGRDKGAAKLLREKLDEIKRSKGQEVIAAEWAEKARALLAVPKLNIADAMAWQRDAAKAGAPLSREPLASIKTQLADRVKGIEDLQHRVQVQREAAVLLAQRIEVLSTKSWQDAQAAAQALAKDVPDWQAQAEALLQDTNWASVDGRFPPLLDASRTQLQVVWEAFQSALAQAVAAAQDPAAPLPPVPVWADELRSARGVPVDAPPKAAKPKVDPEVRAQATQAVRDALTRLEQEIAQGHGKASAGAAASLRNALKEHGKLAGDKLENQAHAALAAAGELEGWQRWRADQLRQELVAKAEGLFERPAPVEGQEPQPPKPRYGGRKMQEQLRALREQWKQTDQGGVPNHGLWKRFDDACNEAYKVVEAWLEKVKAESAEHKAQRLALIEEVKAWAAANPTAKDADWKGFNRILHQFEARWREAGHLSEKAFVEMQALWKATIQAAAAPLEAVQKESLERRHAMIDEAKALGAAPQLRVDAVKALQQRWQAEAQAIPLDRKHEQKLWDAFRKPIDDAFNRKTEEREKAAAQLSERDRVVLDASKALEAANASGDAQKIKAAMAALEAALRGQAQAAAAVQAAGPALVAPAVQTPPAEPASAEAASDQAAPAGEDASEAAASDGESTPDVAAAPPPPPKPSPKPVVAMRGDDRPGMKKTEPAAPMRGGKFGDRKGGPGAGKFGERRDDRGAREPRTDGRFGGGRFGDRDAPQDRGPRLGDVAFRAQREALDHAQLALKKLAAQAHGEALTQLMTAWEQRSGEQVPTVQELGKAVSAAVRNSWVQAVSAPSGGDAAEALLRLEIAAEVPTPADHLSARRMLQLQLLTRRNDPSPAQTWGQDAAKVLSGPYEPGTARRLQNVLKTLLR
jgi:ATP-dependent RNA helicase SUPV3L1/SUV3